jgi:uncharacterized protein (TIGR00369 family)
MIMIRQKTHSKINNDLSGEIIELKENHSKVKLKANSKMIVDETGLIHGGFIFSVADFSAMVAINHPNVVLGGANVKFLKPVIKGDIIIAEAKLSKIEGKKHIVQVDIRKNEDLVFSGEFQCFIPEKHVLKTGDDP